VLQRRLEKDTNDLQCLYLEVNDAVNNIERLKQQIKSVKKEKSSTRKVLKKIRKDGNF
jgi:predicted transcriptional regulator